MATFLENLLQHDAKLVARWQGHPAKLLELSSSHPSLSILIGDEVYGKNLRIGLIYPLYLCCPTQWRDTSFVLKTTRLASGEEGVVLIDERSGVRIIAGTPFVSENVKWAKFGLHGLDRNTGKSRVPSERTAAAAVSPPHENSEARRATDLTEANSRIAQWRGKRARILELALRVNDYTLSVRLEEENLGENLVIALSNPLYICGPTRWENASIVLQPMCLESGREGVTLIDESREVRIVAETVAVSENVKC